jgi:DNA-binding NarL/FixJ family response regulator
VCGEAANGREAIEKAQQLHPDLIVTDLSMPVMNGLEEARYLKKLMPGVPVIIYSAHSDPFVEKEARSPGAFAVVSKSDSVGALIAAARSAFEQVQQIGTWLRLPHPMSKVSASTTWASHKTDDYGIKKARASGSGNNGADG